MLDAQLSSSHACSSIAAADASAPLRGVRVRVRVRRARSLLCRVHRGGAEREGRRQEEEWEVRTGDVDGAVLAEQDVAGLYVPAARNERAHVR